MKFEKIFTQIRTGGKRKVMKKLKVRVAAWIMLFALVLSSSASYVTLAEEVSTQTAAETNPLEVSEEDIASGRVLYVTAGMVAANGTLVIAEGSWDKIVITKEVAAEKITLTGITAAELVVESGTKCEVAVTNATVGNLSIVKPQLEEVGYVEICKMLDSGMDASKVVEIYRNYLETKAALDDKAVTITAGANAEIQTVTVSGNSKLELGAGKVAEVKIEAKSAASRLQVTVADYDGKVSVNQEMTDKTAWNVVNLQIEDSNLSELTISGDGTCTVAKQGDSKVADVTVTGSSNVQLRVPADNVKVDENANNASLKIYDNVGELSAEGENVKIAVSSSAKVDNQENVSSDVKVTVGIKTPGTSSSSSSSKPKPTATPTPTPEPTPDVDEDEGNDPSDYPEVTPGGDDTTGTSTGGALTPGEDEEDSDLEYAPEDWFEWEEDGDGVVITAICIPYDEDTGELVDFDGILVIPETLGGEPVVGLGESTCWYTEIADYITEIILPENLVYIMDYAFDGTCIESITIPAGVEEISEYAFDEAGYLAEIIVAEENETYSSMDGCLYDKEARTLIRVPAAISCTCFEIPEGVETVAKYAFNGTWIETIVLGTDVEEFSFYSYSGCAALQEMEVADGNEYFVDYGDYVLTADNSSVIFVDSSVSEFEIPKKMTDFNISVFAYSGCLPLESITVEDGNDSYIVGSNGILYTSGYTEIVHATNETETYFLENCITEFILPEETVSIGAYAFYDCDSIMRIEMTDNVTSIGSNAFAKCSSLQNLLLSPNISRIPGGMCYGCENLLEMEIYDGVQTINSHAFYGCDALEYIYIPDSVRTISTTFIERNSSIVLVTTNEKVIKYAERYGWTVE